VGSYLTKYSPKKTGDLQPEGRNAIVEEMKKLKQSDGSSATRREQSLFRLSMQARFLSETTGMDRPPSRLTKRSRKRASPSPMEWFFQGRLCGLPRPFQRCERGTKKRGPGEAFINYCHEHKRPRGFHAKALPVVTNQEIVKDIPAVMKPFLPRHRGRLEKDRLH